MTVYVNAKIIENEKIISDDSFIIKNKKIETGKAHSFIRTSPECSDMKIINLFGKTIFLS